MGQPPIAARRARAAQRDGRQTEFGGRRPYRFQAADREPRAGRRPGDDRAATAAAAAVSLAVSVGTEEQFGTYGNRIGLLSVPLFTNEPDPAERLRKTHEALRIAKDRHRALPAELLQDATQFIPPAVFAWAARVTFSLAATRTPARSCDRRSALRERHTHAALSAR